MPTVVEMPRLSDTMREGTIAEWLVKVGEEVKAGEALADVETDKATMTFDSFDDGVLLQTLVEPGDTVPLGTPICVLGKAGEDVSALVAELAKKVEAAKAAAEAGEAGGEEAEAESEEAPAAEAAPAAEVDEAPAAEEKPAPAQAAASTNQAPTAQASLTDADGVRIKVSPLARRIASERGVDLATVAGSGPGGRIIKRDVEDLDPTRRVQAGGAAVAREDTTVRVTQMRKTIAKRLVEAKQTAPHFYLTSTWRVDRLVRLRAELNASQDRLKLSYNDLVMRAVIVALLDHPEVNAGWEGKVIRRFGSVNLGFAVALPDGLITPVVRASEQLGLVELGLKVREMASAAREGTLEAADWSGNSFCVSNLGMFGIEHFTAVINPPAACILAVGALRDEVVVDEGCIVQAKVITATLSCDHRVVDGAMGAAFMKDLGEVMENPMRMLV